MTAFLRKLMTILMLSMVTIGTTTFVCGCEDDSAIEDAAEETEDAAEDAADAVEDAADEMGDEM